MGNAKYVTNDNKKFVNPYNFVSLPKKVNNREMAGHGNLTGKLHCKINTKTPLAILDTESVKYEGEHPVYGFCKIDGQKCIPGSSIRGLLRSTYETVTDSCFVTMPEDDYLSARVNHATPYAPGLLIREDGVWKLYSAKRLSIQTNRSGDYKTRYSEIIQNGERCITDGQNIFRLGDNVLLGSTKEITRRTIVESISPAKENRTEYYVYVGEPIKNKKYQSVFKKGQLVKCSQDDMKNAIYKLEYTVGIYQDSSVNRKFEKNGDIESHYGYSGFKRAEKEGVIPLWYKQEDGHLYLSMAAIGRKVYENTVNDFVGFERVPCESRKRMCPACTLFGMANGESKGSLIRVSDAYETKCGSLKTATLKELGSPRTSYYKFYSVDGKEYDSEGAMISGRKYYWHNSKASADEKVYKTDEKNNRNATVDLLSNSEFEFDIFFDDITEEQLKELKWVITLGENTETGKMCHKIGHGKPLGLGSVKITILEEQIREYGLNSGYVLSKNTDVEIESDSKALVESAVKQILIINDFNIMDGKDVRYPYVVESDNYSGRDLNLVASHHWFSENHKSLSPIGSGNYEFSALSLNSNLKKQSIPKDNHQSKSPSRYKIGDVFEGNAIKRSKNDMGAVVKLSNGDTISVYDPTKQIKNGPIKVKFIKVNNKGYDVWNKV